MKVTSVYRKDKIGTLSHNLGNVNMASSIVTIGGLQYDTEGSRSVALPAMIANTRYQIYAVLSGGDIILIVSQNENSNGPAGYTSWKLVASLYSNGLSSVGFGSFVNIVGTPSSSLIDFDTTSTFVSNIGYDAAWLRDGKYIKALIRATFTGTPNNPANTIFQLPNGLSIDISNVIPDIVGSGRLVSGGIGYSGRVQYVSNTSVSLESMNASATHVVGNNLTGTSPATIINGNFIHVNIDCAIQGWSNTAIEDL
jgi:hypothetical protein